MALGGGCRGRSSAGSSALPERRGGVDDAQLTNVEPLDFSALAGFCEGASAITAEEHETRRLRARELAAESGFDAILLEAGPSLLYFTGVRWGLSERPLLYILPVDGEPRWLGPAFEAGTLREQAAGTGEVHLWQEHEGPYERFAEHVQGAKRFAVDPAMRLFVVDGLRAAIPSAQLLGDPGLIRAARIIKSPAELALLRRANEATKASLAQVAAGLAPGMRESEIRARVRDAQQAAGLTDIWALVLVGSNAAFPHGTEHERTLGEGEALLIDTGGSLHGYRSDISRTWSLGAAAPEVVAAWEVVREAQTRSLAAMRPGVSCGSIDAIARAVIEDAGHGPGYRRFTHRLGHGIGLQVHEDPYLVGGDPTILGPGMVMSNEPGLYVPGSWGVRIEDIVAITEDGAEVFGPRIGPLDDPFAPPA